MSRKVERVQYWYEWLDFRSERMCSGCRKKVDPGQGYKSKFPVKYIVFLPDEYISAESRMRGVTSQASCSSENDKGFCGGVHHTTKFS